jgi:hypothetical protein
MEFNKNCFPINITTEDAVNIFSKEFCSKGHNIKINKEGLRLVVLPYWVCFFDIDTKIDGKYKHISGQTALNATKNKIEDDILKLFEFSNPKLIKNLEINVFEKTEVKIKKLVISQKESEKIILKTLLSKYTIEKEEVALSGFDEIWVPFWKITVDKKDFIFDATDNKLNNFKEIKVKQKNNNQLFQEMIEEIKEPSRLLEYVLWVFKNIFLGLKKAILYVYKHNTVFLLIFLILLAILLLL